MWNAPAEPHYCLYIDYEHFSQLREILLENNNLQYISVFGGRVGNTVAPLLGSLSSSGDMLVCVCVRERERESNNSKEYHLTFPSLSGRNWGLQLVLFISFGFPTYGAAFSWFLFASHFVVLYWLLYCVHYLFMSLIFLSPVSVSFF